MFYQSDIHSGGRHNRIRWTLRNAAHGRHILAIIAQFFVNYICFLSFMYADMRGQAGRQASHMTQRSGSILYAILFPPSLLISYLYVTHQWYVSQ